MGVVYRGFFGKKRGKPDGGSGGGDGKLSDLYVTMFKYRGILPDELGRQDPRVLLDMLDTLNGGVSDNYTDNYDSPYIRAVFG